MRFVAVVFLLAIFIRNFSIFGGLWDWTGFTPQAMFYMLGGAFEVVVCGLIAFLVHGYARSFWRDLVMIGCVIGAIEGSTTTGCRLMVAYIYTTPTVPLCDFSFGIPFQGWRITLYLIFLTFWGLWGIKMQTGTADIFTLILSILMWFSGPEVAKLITPYVAIVLASGVAASWALSGIEIPPEKKWTWVNSAWFFFIRILTAVIFTVAIANLVHDAFASIPWGLSLLIVAAGIGSAKSVADLKETFVSFKDWILKTLGAKRGE